LNSTFRVITEIQQQLQIQYGDLKLQTFVNIPSLPPKVYDNGCLMLNNTRPTHFKEESELKLEIVRFVFITKQQQIMLPNQWWKSMDYQLDDQNPK